MSIHQFVGLDRFGCALLYTEKKCIWISKHVAVMREHNSCGTNKGTIAALTALI